MKDVCSGIDTGTGEVKTVTFSSTRDDEGRLVFRMLIAGKKTICLEAYHNVRKSPVFHMEHSDITDPGRVHVLGPLVKDGLRFAGCLGGEKVALEGSDYESFLSCFRRVAKEHVEALAWEREQQEKVGWGIASDYIDEIMEKICPWVKRL